MEGGELWILIGNLLINVGSPVFVIVLAMVVGTILEKKHYVSIREREEKTLGLPAIPSEFIEEGRPITNAWLVSGSVCVSLDYFKRFLAGLRNIIGGRVRSYESLVDRGRREATLRMKAQALDADIIINFRMETSTIASTSRKGKRRVGCVETLAYGTAVKYG